MIGWPPGVSWMVPRVGRRPVHLLAGELAAVPDAGDRLDVDGAEEPEPGGAAGALRADGDGLVVEEEGVLVLGEPLVLNRFARCDDAALVDRVAELVEAVLADEVAVGGDVVDELHVVDVHADVTVTGPVPVGLVVPGLRCRHLGRTCLARRGGVEEVLEIDGDAVTDVGAEHERAGTLVGPEHDLAGSQDAALGLAETVVLVHHVSPQRVHEAVGVDRPETVVDDDLVDGDHVGVDVAVALAVGGGLERSLGGGDDRRRRCGERGERGKTGGPGERGDGDTPGEPAAIPQDDA